MNRKNHTLLRCACIGILTQFSIKVPTRRTENGWERAISFEKVWEMVWDAPKA